MLRFKMVAGKCYLSCVCDRGIDFFRFDQGFVDMNIRFFLNVLGGVSLAFIGLVSGQSAPTQLNSLKAIVNGEPITQVDLDEAVRTQVQVYLMKK